MYAFLIFPFDISRNSIYFTYVPNIGYEGLILSQSGLSRIESPELNQITLIENYEYSICLGWPILLLYAPAIRPGFLKSFLQVRWIFT